MNKYLFILAFYFLLYSTLKAQGFNWLTQISQDVQYPPPPNFNGDEKEFHYLDVSSELNDNYAAGVSKIPGETDGKFLFGKYSRIKLPGLSNMIWEKEISIGPGNSVYDETVYCTYYWNNKLFVGGEANGLAQFLIVNSANGQLINKANITGDLSRIIEIVPEYSTSGFPKAYYAIGYFNGSIEFGHPGQTNILKTLTSAGESDIFIAKFMSSGAFINAISLSGIGHEFVFDAHSLKNGSLLISAFTSGNINGVYNNSGSNCDLILLKLKPTLTTSVSSYTLEYSKNILESQIALKRNFLPFSCYGGIDNSGTNFRIDINKSESELFYVIGNYNIDNQSILGKLNVSNGNDILPKIFVNNKTFYDIEIGKCDKLFIAANSGMLNGGPGEAAGLDDYTNLAVSKLISYNSTNLNFISEQISNYAGKSEQISINEYGQVIMVGSYKAECTGYSYNNDLNITLTPYECAELVYSYSINGFIGLYNSGSITQQNLISGPAYACPYSYPIKYNINSCGANVNSFIIQNPITPGISYSGELSGIWVTNLNGYSGQFFIYSECITDCGDVVYSFLPVTALNKIVLNSNDLTLNISTSGSSIVATASYPILSNTLIKYKCELLNGNGNLLDCNFGTLLRNEIDDYQSGGGIYFPNTGLSSNKKYVVKMTAYYDIPIVGICSGESVKRCFWIY
jgi:hypothetical protein